MPRQPLYRHPAAGANVALPLAPDVRKTTYHWHGVAIVDLWAPSGHVVWHRADLAPAYVAECRRDGMALEAQAVAAALERSPP